MFSFNSDKYDFWLIYEKIKQFYPIGIRQDESCLFASYSGQKDLEKIIVDNIHENGNFRTRWTNFTDEIAEEINKEVIGTTYGQAPCFSSSIVLGTENLANLTRTKELHFLVSLVGPFYSIVGTDSNLVTIENKYFTSTNFLTVSPEKEYLSLFPILCEKIEIRFKNFRFVPFWIYAQTLDGLEVKYSNDKLSTIFNAIFNNQIDLTANIQGDKYYKSEDWIRTGYVDEGDKWTSYPPMT